jgi:transposase
METMERRKPRPRRTFTPEFKAQIVELCREGDRSIGQVAKDFDLGETAVRAWVRQAETDAGERPGLTTEERAELIRLRRENRRLQMDVDLLKRATAFFAFMQRFQRVLRVGSFFRCPVALWPVLVVPPAGRATGGAE